MIGLESDSSTARSMVKTISTAAMLHAENAHLIKIKKQKLITHKKLMAEKFAMLRSETLKRHRALRTRKTFYEEKFEDSITPVSIGIVTAIRKGKYKTFDLEMLTDRDVKGFFRFTREQIYKLVKVLNLDGPQSPFKEVLKKVKLGSAVEAVCILLARLASTSTYRYLGLLFLHSDAFLSNVFVNVCTFIYQLFADRLHFDEAMLSKKERLEAMYQAVYKKGKRSCGKMPDHRIVSFVDGSVLKTSRPKLDYVQAKMYNGMKSVHGLKFQLINTADGLIVCLSNVEGASVHDSRHLMNSNVMPRLKPLFKRSDAGENGSNNDDYYEVFGDKAYQWWGRTEPCFRSSVKLHRKSVINRYNNREIKKLNRKWAKIRICNEWTIGICSKMFPLPFSGRLRIGKEKIDECLYVVAILTNIMTCMNGGNQTSKYFDIAPPTVEEYVSGQLH